MKKDPKWIVGFSDVTVLHNALANLGVASLHAQMPHNIAVSLLCPHKGTEVYDQVKDRIIHQPEDVEYGYWHQTEMWKHDRYSYAELQEARDWLTSQHRKKCMGFMARVQRKWERLVALVRHPELFRDLMEIRARRKAYRKRVASWVGKDGRMTVDAKVGATPPTSDSRKPVNVG